MAHVIEPSPSPVELEAKYPEVRHLSAGEPNYGKALRLGILAARGELVLADEIDLCDTDFHRRAIDLLRAGTADLVIGSKLIGGAEDERPFFRHAASLLYTSMLRLLLGFRGTDTHGLKGFRRTLLLPVAEACLVEKDVFASEFVIRAHRDFTARARNPHPGHGKAPAHDQPDETRAQRATRHCQVDLGHPSARLT